MAISPYQFMPEELASVGAHTQDPALRALEVAIFLEEAVDIVLPDAVLDPVHLGTPEAALGTLDGLTGTP